MMFWKRVEIYCGYSLKEFSDLRNALKAKGILYDYKVVNNLDNGKRMGRFGLNSNYDKLYYLYVHHQDYDKAMFCTSNRHSYIS